ncbi:ATP-dependent helicase HepA [Posidoniimonas polymericola]|uniref:ATP-dependent helicase HepA n=1 Tax=Posidoniimonas polymericola TaxID=2528002 RepID=A0A5C5YL40_9BACT|nr:DEAD/DEAH box helicase [Posidoniimonas polymericola]TWT75567.1 ATP-dependent helicase HepA [Posidoniimonas polymericola]
MSVLQEVKPLFSSAVRQRGDAYAAAGQVNLVEQSDDCYQFEVEGSGGAIYDVFLEDLDSNELYLECSCPHFDDGHHCKHLWAALRTVERVRPTDDRRRPTRQGGLSLIGKAPSPAFGWQQALNQAEPHREAPLLGATADVERRVFYLLDVSRQDHTPEITLLQSQRLNDGGWGKVKPLQIDSGNVGGLDAPHDRDVLGLLLGSRVTTALTYSQYNYGARSPNAQLPTRVALAAPLFGAVLPALAATGRFAWLLSGTQDWEDAQTIAWDAGDPWRFRLRTKPFDRGRRWRLTGELVRGDQSRPLRDAVYCFSAGLLLMDNLLAPFRSPPDDRWLEALRANDELVVPKSERDSLLQELWRAGEPPELTGDDSLCLTRQTGEPRGRLVVHPPSDRQSYGRDPKLYASVSYVYEDNLASADSEVNAWPTPDGGRMIARDGQRESELFNRLLELGLAPRQADYFDQTPPGHLQMSPRQLTTVVETLVDEGWSVEAEGTLVRRGGGVSVSVKSGVDWFDLEGEVDFGGATATLPELLRAIRSGERYILLGDGTRGLLPQQWIDRYAPLGELGGRQEGESLRFQTGQALLLDSLLSGREADHSVEIDRKFAAWRKRLASFQGVTPAAAPRSFRGELRDYQREGLGWLRFLEKFGFGGCLADDMGLGKTIQVLALLADRRRRQPRDAERRPSLVVAPKSLVYNWKLEAERFAPKLAVADYTGIDRAERVGEFTDYDLVLTTYGTLRQDVELMAATPWDYAILDEAQAIKNAASQTAKASRVLNARCRLALSGTPVENHLGELWSIFEFLNPGLLGTSGALGELTKSSRDEEQQSRLAAIRRGIAPFLLRRTKEQVLPQLPKKSEQQLYCELPPAQRKQYNDLRNHYRASLEERIAKTGLAKSKVHVLEALLRLRQAACHPGLIDKRRRSKPSAKLNLLLEQLHEVLGEGHKALIFSQFTTMLDIVRDRLDKAGVVYEHLDGKTRDRQRRVERFQNDDACQAFLISLKAGGCGLNLTAAEYVFLLDPWWNPAVEAQAIDRAHRLGQEKPVFAYRLIARDTVEEKILRLQAGKRELAEAIISADSSLLRTLTSDDLQMLLG